MPKDIKENMVETYTVDNLLIKLLTAENIKAWKVVPSATVKGIVANIKIYDKAYFDLIGSGKRIRACCPKEDTPSEGAAITFNGIVTLQNNKYNTNLHFMVNGTPVGTWEKHKEETLLTTSELVKYNNQPLSNVIERFQTQKLLLIGTETAINDVLATVYTDSVDIISTVVTVSQKEKVIGALKQLKNDRNTPEQIAAFAVVRGGDDDSMDVWDEPQVVRALIDVNIPFFTALGHSHRITLADKYAAQSFPSPGNFASSFNEEYKNHEFRKGLELRNMRLEKQIKESEIQAQQVEEKRKHDEKTITVQEKKNRTLKGVFILMLFLFTTIIILLLLR